MATKQGSDKPNPMRLYGAGFTFIATFMLPLWAGYWVDMKMGTLPRLMILGAVIGFLVGLRNLVREARKFFHDQKAVTGESDDENEADNSCDSEH